VVVLIGLAIVADPVAAAMTTIGGMVMGCFRLALKVPYG
jgi:hypothetical protein